MFLPWRDHSFLWDEDDIGWLINNYIQWFNNFIRYPLPPPLLDYWQRINNPVTAITGVPFRETGQETVTQEILYFDALIPPDDIPNHLLLLYLNIGVFLLLIGLIFTFCQFNIVILALIMIIMGLLNIIFQVSFSFKITQQC